MDHSEQIIKALNEITDEVRALRDDQSQQHATNQRRWDENENYVSGVQRRFSRDSAQAWVSYLTLLTLLLATAIVVLILNR